MVQRSGALRGLRARVPTTAAGCAWKWQHLFGQPAAIAAAWREYLEGPAEEARRNTARLAARLPYNRPVGWLALRQAEVERAAAASPG